MRIATSMLIMFLGLIMCVIGIAFAHMIYYELAARYPMAPWFAGVPMVMWGVFVMWQGKLNLNLKGNQMKYSILYISTVVLINIAFTYIAPFQFELFGANVFLTIGSVVAGGVFVARDYAQREVGHKAVLLLMLAAGAISYLMADPFVAIASISAFAVAELSDYLVFTFKKGSFNNKVIWSSLIGVPIDTVIFLAIISHLSALSFIVMCISKIVVLIYLVRKQ